MHLRPVAIAIIYTMACICHANESAKNAKTAPPISSRSSYSQGVSSGPGASSTKQENTWHIKLNNQATKAELTYERISKTESKVIKKHKLTQSNTLTMRTITSKGKSTVTILLNETPIDTIENAEAPPIMFEPEKNGANIVLFDTALRPIKDAPRIRASVASNDA